MSTTRTDATGTTETMTVDSSNEQRNKNETLSTKRNAPAIKRQRARGLKKLRDLSILKK